jgi:hypothetical protein
VGLSLIQQIPQDWRSVLQNTLALPSTAELFAQVEHAYHNKIVYPPQEKLFQALELTPFAQVKVAYWVKTLLSCRGKRLVLLFPSQGCSHPVAAARP